MRDIRRTYFRGKSIESGEEVEGSLLSINDKTYIYPYDYGELDDIDFGWSFIEVTDVEFFFPFDQ